MGACPRENGRGAANPQRCAAPGNPGEWRAVFKTVGDAFQAAFPTALQALKAAVEGQKALQAAAWNELGALKVRMGLHTGEAELDPGGDEYAVSHTKNRVARIMSAAHGGQILLSQEAKELVDHQLPRDVALKDMGEHHLKGMTIIEHLYQVCTPGLEAEFPSLEARQTACSPPARGLTILASSREILGVEGEAPFRVPPLSMPDPRRLPPVEQLAEYDGVRLFVERAIVASPEFVLSENNARQVAQIVQRLDGIPLAIELAAARLKLLGVDQLAERLNDTFRLLTGGSRSVLPRHQTLRACIDWSYNLLSEAERFLLRQLSVFVSWWSLPAAEGVCAGDPTNPQDILDLLAELLDKSLISAEAVTGSRNRYRMLETVRQYAHEKLVDEGEAEVLRTRHLQFFQKFVELLITFYYRSGGVTSTSSVSERTGEK